MKNKIQVVYLAASDLKPYEKNPRTHSESQIAQLVNSIREYGFTNPILIDGDKNVIAGHGRLLAAVDMGLKSVPTIQLSGMTEVQKRAYIIADNKLAENAGWDDELLAIELGELLDAGFDADLIGFTDEEIEEITNRINGIDEGLTDPDDVPDFQEKPVTNAGDVWILNKHRLMCGDSTNQNDVETLLNGARPNLMVTDPPYGVDYDANWRNEAAEKGQIAYGAQAVSLVTNDDRIDWSEAFDLFPGSVAYVWHASAYGCTVMKSLNSCGLEIRSQIIWVKNRFAISRGHYHWKHEPCWYAVREGETADWQGDRSQTTVWEITHLKSDTGHSTQKPVEAMRIPIENNSSIGDAVYEPFCGSGTTIIAAQETGRSCYAMEITPQYVDLAIRRWQEFTGHQAILESNGSTFDDVS